MSKLGVDAVGRTSVQSPVTSIEKTRDLAWPGGLAVNTELLKWIGLIAMVADHVNMYLFNRSLPALTEIGRLAMPLFAMCLAANLARDSTGAKARWRIGGRLLVFALASSAVLTLLNNSGPPLNILYTLLLVVGVVSLLEGFEWQRVAVAILLFLLASAFVEYRWAGVAVGVSTWFMLTRPPNGLSALLWVLCVTALYGENNGVHWALLSLPIFILACAWRVPIGRTKWFFYCFYPVHLAVLAAIRVPIAKTGYLFIP